MWRVTVSESVSVCQRQWPSVHWTEQNGDFFPPICAQWGGLGQLLAAATARASCIKTWYIPQGGWLGRGARRDEQTASESPSRISDLFGEQAPCPTEATGVGRTWPHAHRGEHQPFLWAHRGGVSTPRRLENGFLTTRFKGRRLLSFPGAKSCSWNPIRKYPTAMNV